MPKRNGKKGRLRSAENLPHIGAALVPTTAFWSVPRTPPPPTPHQTAGMSSLQFHNSLVGRTPPELPDDEPFSDPESSLFDYQQMEEPGYVSVNFDTWPKRRSMSDREPARTPSPGPSRGSRGSRGRENDVDDFKRQSGAMYHVLESTDVNENDIYAVPDKSRKSKTGVTVVDETFVKEVEGDLGTMGTTRDVHNAMQAVHDLPGFEGEEPVRMRRSGELRGSKIMSHGSPKIGRKSPVMGRKSPMMGRKSPLLGHSSQRRETDKINSASVNDMEGKEDVRPEINKTIDIEMDDNIAFTNSTGKGTTGHMSTRVTIQERNSILESENLQMRDLLEQNRTELQTLRQVASAVKEGDTESAASLMFRKQVDDLKEENEVLKQSTHRLNVELSNLQAIKDAPILAREARDFTGLPRNGPVPSWLISKRYLAPLFLAYDDRLKQKDEIIGKYQEKLSNLEKRVNEIVRENQQYHTGGGSLGLTEWQQLQEQAKLVLEENQILMEQIDVQQKKSKEMFDVHMQEVSRLTKKMSLAESEKIDLERDLEEARLKYSELRHKHDQLVLSTGGQVAVQDHINTIADIKRSVTEEKDQHLQETEKLNNKIKAVDEERRILAVKNTDLVAENKRLHAEIHALHKAVKRAQHKLFVFQKAVEQSECKELNTQEHLANVIKLAEKTAAERDTYAKVAKEQQSESKRAMNKVLAGTVTVGKLEERFKLYKMKAEAKRTTLADRLKIQDETFNSQKQEYEREIKYLRLLLNEKESLLQNLEYDKREVEQDLETMWQAANSENLRMKDTMRKSTRKLRDHPGLRDMVEDVDKDDDLHLSPDEDA